MALSDGPDPGTPPRVLDTSAILSGKDLPRDAPLVAPDAIREEITPGGPTYRTFQHLRETGLTLRIPAEDARERVRAAASETGDDGRLSPVDLDVLALALEVHGTVVTDDYSVQNVAKHLDLPFQGINQGEIQEVVRWVHRCRACGRVHDDPLDACPVCGSEVITVRDRSHEQG